MKHVSSKIGPGFFEGLIQFSNKHPQSDKQRISAALAMGLVLLLAGFAITPNSRAIPAPAYNNSLLTVQTTQLSPASQYVLKRFFLGRVEAARSSDLGFELGGKIDRILVDEGDQVSKGQVLAHLDIDRLQARKKELVSALKQARANLQLADITYRRYKKVVISSGVSRQQLDEAKEHLNATEAAMELARARIETIDIEIEKSRLIAPFNADVTFRRMDEGQVVAAGSPILRLQENSSTELRVGIAGKIVDSIQAGQVIPVVVNHFPLQASVKAIVPVRDGKSRTVDVILSINDLPSQVRAGDLVKVELSMNIGRDGYWIPVSALSEGSRGIWSVYTLQSESDANAHHHTVRRRTIEIVHAESERVFIEGFFEKDTQVVTDGLQRIVPGQQVQSSIPHLASN